MQLLLLRPSCSYLSAERRTCVCRCRAGLLLLTGLFIYLDGRSSSACVRRNSSSLKSRDFREPLEARDEERRCSVELRVLGSATGSFSVGLDFDPMIRHVLFHQEHQVDANRFSVCSRWLIFKLYNHYSCDKIQTNKIHQSKDACET